MSVASNRQLVVAGIATAGIATAVILAILRHRHRRATEPKIIATIPSKVTGRSWYRQIVVTEHGGSTELEALRSLHLGEAENVPESTVRLRRPSAASSWRPVAAELLKPHLCHSLLAFCFLPEGFPAGDGRAALMGVAGGSLLHFWRECLPGGDTLRVDAVELDAAVLDAAYAHLGLSACLAPPSPPNAAGVSFHVADAADFLRAAEDEEYSLLMVDLDMGSLVETTSSSAAAASSAASDAAAPQQQQQQQQLQPQPQQQRPTASKRLSPPAPDPTRDMYRVLREDGVLVINEYSEEAPSKRLESSLRLVRLLRRFFPEVHVLRTNTNHNTMILAPVTKSSLSSTPDLAALAKRASACCAHLGMGGVDLGALVRAMPPNRYQVYH